MALARFSFFKCCALLLSVIFTLSLKGCVLSRLEKELTDLEDVHVLSGRIMNPTSADYSAIILIFDETLATTQLVRASIVKSVPGHFAIEVPSGAYYLVAFEDMNNNLAYDDNEPVGIYDIHKRVKVSEASPHTLSGIDISFGNLPQSFHNIIKTVILTPETLQGSFVKLGKVADLGNPIFTQEFGTKGYWEPLTFVRD
ncbi:hypothetical protein JZU68_00305, partial [bacterium]|nr:hypothetical protein [bacterium]